jgi:hypothetical protein
MAMQHVQVHAACPCSCHAACLSTSYMPTSKRHAHVHGTCLMPISMLHSMYMLLVQVHTACPCQCSMFRSMQHVQAHSACSSPCNTDMDTQRKHGHGHRLFIRQVQTADNFIIKICGGRIGKSELKVRMRMFAKVSGM